MQTRPLVLCLALVACGGGAPLTARPFAAGARAVGVADALAKIRPDAALPSSSAAALDAARNEFEPFQIVLAGGAAGIGGVRVAADDLVGPGARIAAANFRFYQVGLYHVVYASNVEGAPGEWPDPLIPDVDSYAGEQRNGLPFDVAANTTRAVWIDLYVPRAIPAGMYSGAVHVTSTSGLAATDVPVSLRVRDFDLPSTSSLKSAFGFSVDNACRAHHGTAYCNSDADAAPLIAVYGRAALEHRISFWNPYYTFPSNGDFATFDANSGPLLSGTSPSRLAGAAMTTTALGTRDPNGAKLAKQHFDAKGWKGLFDYTCDEPPATCAFSDIPVRAQPVHAAGARTLVTTDIAKMGQYGLLDAIDIACPVIDALQPAGGADDRPSYDAFLARSTAKELWTYQSCDEHGCASGCTAAQASDPTAGWPQYMIDGSALQNRAMQWLDYKERVSGELYFETLMHLDDAWNSHVAGHNALCDFGGNGDGALFYPGTPAKIGGKTDIPVESQRLKLIREGMEDYEYLHLLESLGGGADARATVAALFPATYKVTTATPAQLYAARAHLADLIEQRLGTGAPPLVVAHADGAIDLHGSGAEFAAATPIAVAAGAGKATFRMLWDEQALYVDAEVADRMLSVIGTGHNGELWNADGVELMLDALHDRSLAPDADDRHVIVTVAGDLLEARGAGAGEDRGITMGSQYVVTTMGTVNSGMPATGYRVMLAVPWSGVGVTPAGGQRVGVDLALNDLDGTALTSNDWSAMSPFAQPSRWNTVQLAAATGGAPGDGTGGTAGGAPGSGGNGNGARGGKHGGCDVVAGAAPITSWPLVLVASAALAAASSPSRCRRRR